VECALSPRNLLRARRWQRYSAVGEVVASRCYRVHEKANTRETENERERDRERERDFAEGGGHAEGRKGRPRTLCHLSLTAAYFRRWFSPSKARRQRVPTKMPRNSTLHLIPFPAYSVPSRTIAVTSSACNSVALPS